VRANEPYVGGFLTQEEAPLRGKLSRIPTGRESDERGGKFFNTKKGRFSSNQEKKKKKEGF